jgi:5-methylcytosine-specific restriction enzyme subunit McrC
MLVIVSARNILTLYEYQTISDGDLKKKIADITGKKIDDHYIDFIKAELDAINKRMKDTIIEPLREQIKCTQYLGLVQLRDFSIQILPKVFKPDAETGGEDEIAKNMQLLWLLIEYINETGIALKFTDFGLLGKHHANMLEFLIRVFVKRLREILAKDHHRDYFLKNENINYMKGKLLWKEHLLANAATPWRFYCAYDEFNDNTLINRIIKFTLCVLGKAVLSFQTKKNILELLEFFTDVDDVAIKREDFKAVHFTRLNLTFKPIVDFCYLIVDHSDIDFATRTINNFYFVFDMNRLFQQFLTKFMQSNKNDLKVDKTNAIIEIHGDRHPIGTLFDVLDMRPDIRITYETTTTDRGTIILDFKNKELDQGKPHWNIPGADLHQLFAYSRGAKSRTNRLVLLFPQPSIKIPNALPVFHHTNDDEKISLFVKTIDLSKIFRQESNQINKDTLIVQLNQVLDMHG